ncbi:neuraminidase-like domain-containing protein [Streptomyces sp. NBC_00154]|uniref:Tc toxin subunit A-related protein n=1 Tax=Streptomyces sp. NBC_00154 TaxID=2975670 RepID=UPI00224E0E90|nr:neuraminidase-like domain-containing protein [Streptomyces sp. NBC_00154]MCX5314711.1 neuraminidase-like domain-containing protein [Streptomyces sp. NBC_00154]
MRALTSLSPGATGETVADLHQALDKLGFGNQVTMEEREGQRYGDGTRDSVARLHNEFGWPSVEPGVLDRDGARRLTEELIRRGVLHVVRGRLSAAGHSPLPGRLLFAFDADFVNGAQLGEATTTDDGVYRIAYDPRFYAEPGPGHERAKEGPLALVVCAYGPDGWEIARSEPRQDPGPVEEVDLRSAQRPGEPHEPEPAVDFVVHGRVRDRAGRPTSGVLVTAYDRDLGSEREQLGSAVTGADGEFRVSYRAASFRAGEGPGTGADLVFELTTGGQPVTATVYRVFGGVQAALPLDVEDLLLGIPAGPKEEVLFVLDERPAPEGSEYVRLMESLRPLLGERSPATLDEAAHRDVTFAAREVGADWGRIALLVSAHRLAEECFGGQVPAELLYGLSRCDQHLADLPRLTLAGAEQLDAGIRQAIERVVVSPCSDADIAAAVDRIVAAGPELVLAGAAGPAYGPVLETALPDPAAQRALLRVAAGRQDDPRGFWDALSADPAFAEPGTIERAQLALQLDALTGRHLPLMAALQTEHGITATEELLEVSLEELTALVARVGVPAGVPGEDGQSAEVYAAGLLGQVHQAFPTASVARSVAAAPVESFGGEPVRAAVATVLTRVGGGELRERTGFDLGATHLDSFLAEHGHELLDGVFDELRDRVVVELKRVQRLYRVSTGPAAMEWLLAQPYRSAFDIAQLPRQTFLDVSASGLDSAEAMMIHSRSQAIANSMLATYIHLIDGRYSAGIPALNGGKDRIVEVADIDEEVAKYLPTWPDLFGDVNWCACNHCRSIYSPAAYLVDLLHFLDCAKPNGDGQRPLDVLLSRRPDLAQLPLTCENTNTAIPYVDLVTEVLESLVGTLDTTEIPAYDVGDATAAELAAVPQYTDWSSYVTPPAPARPRPDRAAYPHSLPFDAALSAARDYLAHLGVPRAALLETFAAGAPVHALAAERLGLTPAAFELITGVDLAGDLADPVSLDERFGWTVLPPAPLAVGMSGWPVRAVKQKLNAAGAALLLGPDPAAEAYDAALESQAATFQTAQGLPSTGKVDTATWNALLGSGPALAGLLLPHLPTLLDRAGLGYDELIALLETRFLNPARDVFDTVHQLGLPAADLFAYVTGGLAAPSAALLDALSEAGVGEADFTSWAQTNLTGEAWQRVRRTVLTDGPEERGCGLDAVVIRHWADDDRWLAETEWLRLDRLIRLWRATGWSIDDLDLTLDALGATELTAEVVTSIAQIAELAGQLDLTVAQVVALWADLDPTRPGSLYHQRFRNRALLRIDPVFDPDWRGTVLAGAHIGDHLPALQAAMRASDSDLAALRARLGLSSDTATLDLAAVSAMYRHVTLARALGLNVRDLITLLDLTGSTLATPPGPGHWAVRDFVTEVRRLQRGNLNAAQLADLHADLTTPTADPAREKLLKDLGDGLRAIKADLDAATEHGGALTRRALTMLLVPAPLVDATMQILTGNDTATAVLPAPPTPAPVIPSSWADRLLYQPHDKALTVTGAITDAERDTVKGFSTDAGWVAAVDALHTTPRTALAKLAAVLSPEGVTAPVAATLLAAPLSAELVQREADVAARLAIVLDTVLPVLRDREQRTLVKQTMLTLIPDAQTVALLLAGKRTGKGWVLPAIDPGQSLVADLLTLGDGVNDPARRAYELLQRVQVLADGFGLHGADLRALLTNVVPLRSDPMRLLGYPEIRAVAAYAHSKNRTGKGVGRLVELWSAPDDSAAQTVLAEVAGVPGELIADLMAPGGLGLTTADLRDPLEIEQLLAATDVVAALGVATPIAVRWAHQPVGQMAADEIRRAVKARYDETAWLEVSKSLNDAQRDHRRAALVAYLVPRLGTGDANGLYQRLLIDVEMGSCMLTSRIKQAISSVQLFIQRCLLNLESQVPSDRIDQEQWRWMQGHPLWMANRQVLVNPENWILPELRDDKSPFFKDLESELLSGDLTEEAAEHAVATYLSKLDTVAKLDVTAMHVQRDFEPAEKLKTVVHVFGHTANTPQAHFYRRYVVTSHGTASWTPWEPVPVDVQGELVTTVTFNRRLYLFWAQTATKAKEPATNGNKGQPAQYYQEVKLCWSEYRDGAWGPKHVTDSVDILLDHYEAALGQDGGTSVQGTRRPKGALERLETRISGSGDQLRVLCIGDRAMNWMVDNHKLASHTGPYFDEHMNPVPPDGMGHTHPLCTFVLDGCHGELRPETPVNEISPRGAVLRVADKKLQIKPVSQELSPSNTVLGAIDDVRLGMENWIHGPSDYFVVSDTSRAYFGRLTLLGSPLSEVLAKPQHSYPNVLAVDYDMPLAEALSTAHLTAVQAVADGSGHAWAGASSALARAALITPDLRSSPYLLDGHGDGPMVGGRIGGLIKDALISAKVVEWIGAGFALPKPVASITLEPLYDPFACTYLKRLQQYGVPGVLTLANQQLAVSPTFAERYQPDSRIVQTPYPTDLVDFGATDKPGVYQTSACANSHWELFFHIPMLIQSRLRQNRRYEEALRCVRRYVWDFTDPKGNCWKVEPLRTTPKESVNQWLNRLSAGDPDLNRQIAEWHDHPFQPHLLARMRLSAYQKYVVMECLDTLLEWADAQYRLDTMESINQAAQLYVLVAEMLGPRPQALATSGEPAPQTFAMMRGKLDALGNIAAEFENTFPTLSSSTLTSLPESAGLLGISRTLYFCVPPNEKLLGYWDTVADRLFKIRNCMNISGVVRQLPLWENPIDPALLVRAAAQGIDTDSVLANLHAPLPPYRFDTMLRRANDACAHLRGLGSALLAALERRDSEELAALQASQQSVLLRAALESRKKQEEEADAQIEALKVSRDVPAERLRYYRWLMGVDGKTPQPGETVAMASYAPKPQTSGGTYLILEELNELSSSHLARDWQMRATAMNVLASLSHYIPNSSVHTHQETAGSGLEYERDVEVGGNHVGPALTSAAQVLAGLGAEAQFDAADAKKMADYRRLAQSYAIGANSAALELLTIDKQVTTALIRKEITALERRQLEVQIEQAELVEAHHSGKYTKAELYGWMQGRLSSLYFQTYQHAYDLAMQAQHCYRFEHGLTDTDSSIVTFGSWDSLRKGLLAGEELQLQLHQLERAYADHNSRWLELTKHFSLLQHAPMALIKLKETGRCEVDIPEFLYDLDHPGHYQRRIKSVSVTIPAVVGPYASVNATLTMLSNETRIKPTLPDEKYERDLEKDDLRFVDNFAAVQQIATSGGQNDSGLFELNFRDERYLPFEGAGAAGRWRFDLDPDCNPFDLDTVTDVVLHIRYTARDGGDQLRAKAKDRWQDLLKDQQGLPLSRVFSLRHEFPNEWHRLRTTADANAEHSQLIALTRDRFSGLFRNSELTIGALDVFGVPTADGTPTKLPRLRTPKPAEEDVKLKDASPLPSLVHQWAVLAPVPIKAKPEQAQWKLTVAAGDVAASLDQLADLLIVCHYSAKAAPA